MSEIYNDNIKTPKPQNILLGTLKIYVFSRNLAEGLGSTKEHCQGYVVSAFENTTKNLVVQGRVQLEHSSHIVKVGVEATC